MNISKKDWKLFRERLSGWQENYFEKDYQAGRKIIWKVLLKSMQIF